MSTSPYVYEFGSTWELKSESTFSLYYRKITKKKINIDIHNAYYLIIIKKRALLVTSSWEDFHKIEISTFIFTSTLNSFFLVFNESNGQNFIKQLKI